MVEINKMSIFWTYVWNVVRIAGIAVVATQIASCSVSPSADSASEVQSFTKDGWTFGLVEKSVASGEKPAQVSSQSEGSAIEFRFVVCKVGENEETPDVYQGLQEGSCAFAFYEANNPIDLIVMHMDQSESIDEAKTLAEGQVDRAKRFARNDNPLKGLIGHGKALVVGIGYTATGAAVSATAGGVTGCVVGGAGGALLSSFVAGVGAVPGCVSGATIGVTFGAFGGGFMAFTDYVWADGWERERPSWRSVKDEVVESMEKVPEHIDVLDGILDRLFATDNLKDPLRLVISDTQRVARSFSRLSDRRFAANPLVVEWLEAGE